MKVENKDIYENDLIGRKDFVEKILTTIENVSKDKGWCFAINGEWGSGKTFIFNLLKESLINKDDYICITYDAWNNYFYEDPLMALLFTILDYFDNTKGIGEDIKQGIKNVINGFWTILNCIPGVGTFTQTAKKVSNRLTKTREKETNNVALSNYKSYNTLLRETQAILENLTKKKTLVILVDEIDRCTADYAMKVLERIHYLFDTKNTVVIVNLNKKELENVALDKYDELERQRYFNKIFDLIYNIPQGHQNFIQNLCLELMHKNNILYNNDDITKLANILEFEINNLQLREIVQRFNIFNFLISNINQIERDFSLVFAVIIYTNYIITEKTIVLRHVPPKEFRFSNIIDINNQMFDILNNMTVNYLRKFVSHTTTCNENAKITTYTNKCLNELFYFLNMSYFGDKINVDLKSYYNIDDKNLESHIKNNLHLYELL